MAMTSAPRTRPGAESRFGSPGEGGWGVVVVIAAHLSMAIQIGLLRSPGVLYVSWKNDFGTNDKETAVVQGIASALSCFCALPGGILTQRFGCRFTGIAGGVVVFLGHLCTYWVTSIHQLYVTASIIGEILGGSSDGEEQFRRSRQLQKNSPSNSGKGPSSSGRKPTPANLGGGPAIATRVELFN